MFIHFFKILLLKQIKYNNTLINIHYCLASSQLKTFLILLYNMSQGSLEHSGHVQRDLHGDSAQAGQRGSRGCAAADPGDTFDGFLQHK